MAKNKRSKVQRENDLVITSQMYCEGYPQHAIGARLGLTQQQISYDMKSLQKRWVKASVLNITRAKARELNKVDNLEREYWEAWHKSQDNKETRTEKTAHDLEVEADEITIVVPRETTFKSEGQTGSPQFLQGVQWCINKRCQILGLDAAAKNMSIDLTNLSDQQLERLSKGEDILGVIANPGSS